MHNAYIHIYIYIHTYIYLSIASFRRSVSFRHVSLRVYPSFSALRRLHTARRALSLSLTRKDGKCTLLFSPPPTVQAFGNARLLRSSRSYFRLSSLSLSINFSSFFSPSPSFLSLRKIFFSFLPSQSDTSLTTLLAD